MPDNTVHTDFQTNDGKQVLPLHPFYTSLQRNGFLVTPEQIVGANRIIREFSPQVENEHELCQYLSPLFARNEEEQIQFAAIFQTHFRKHAEVAADTTVQKLVKHIQQYWLTYVVSLAIGIGLSVIIYQHSHKIIFTNRPNIYISDKADYTKRSEGRQAFQTGIGEKLTVNTFASYPERDSNGLVKLSMRFNWGDSTEAGTDSVHTYRSAGMYDLAVYSAVSYKNAYQYTDTITQQVKVCGAFNTLQIVNGSDRDSLQTGEKIQLKAVITGEKPDSIAWAKDGEVIGYGEQLETSFTDEGTPSIYCVAIYDSLNSPCTLSRETSFTVYDPDKPVYRATISKGVSAQAIELPYRVKPGWYKLLGALSLGLFIATLIIAMKNRSDKKNRQQSAESTDVAFNELLKSFSGKKRPAELPFRNKNYLPVPEAKINEAAIQMRRRVNNNLFYLDIPKTIEKAIHQNGFFQPLYSPRLQQNEYLVLIDASHNNNQQVKLFDYLTDLIRKQNVFIEKYYYRYEPKWCFNANEPDGVSLETLNEKHDTSTLLIFGNAYQLLYPYYPVFNNEYLPLLDRWQNKAIITPVSYPDWTNKETQALLPQLPVLPVDVPGLLELMDVLFTGDKDIISILNQYRASFYKAADIDFENVAELENYCREATWAAVSEGGKPVNVLFQWIAALAVYPRLRWEVTLAIGKALLDKYGKPEELNFTNLLRITRIKWMKDGQFPDYTRLELLKKLTLENEVVARETILLLLAEIPETAIDKNHFAYEEKEIQRITNEFMLYAYDPIAYSAYKGSKELYEKLWAGKKITDAASRLYFKNQEAQWDTLIGKSVQNKKAQSIPIDDYFSIETTTGKKDRPFYFYLLRTSVALLILFLAGLLGLFVLDLLHTNRFPVFTWRPPVERTIRFQVVRDTGSTKEINLTIDTIAYRIATDTTLALRMKVDDSLKQVAVSYDGSDMFDTAMQIHSDAYRIDISSLKNPPPLEKTSALVYLDNCLTDINLYTTIIHRVDRSIVVEGKKGTDYLQTSNGCLYHMVYGSKIAASKIQAITAAFTTNRINLRNDNPNNLQPQADQMIIYSVPTTAATTRPAIYIQYNNKTGPSIKNIPALRRCLSSNYTVPGVEYQASSRAFHRSEIRYYNQNFADSVKLLQSCLKTVYPNKVFYPVLVRSTARSASAEIWIYDSSNSKPVTERTLTSVGGLNVTPLADGLAKFIIKRAKSELDSSITDAATTLTYGDKISTSTNAYGIAGPFVKNSKGEVFVICSSPVFPVTSNSKGIIYKYEGGKAGPAISDAFQQSKLNPFIGLMKLSKNVSVSNSSNAINGIKEASVKQPVFLYTPNSTPVQSAPVQAFVLSTDYSGEVLGENNSRFKITNAITTTKISAAGLSGSLLVDSDNFAVGILIGGSASNTVFVPINAILKEFGVTLVSAERKASAY